MPNDRPRSVSDLPPVADAARELSEIPARLWAMRWVFGLSIGLIFVGLFRPITQNFLPAFPWITSILGLGGCISGGFWVFKERRSMTKGDEKKFAYFFGVVFVVVLLVMAIAVPNPTAFQYTVFRIVLALAAAGVAAMIPGFLQVTVSNWIRAGGALAIFVIVYFYAPAALVAIPH